MQKIYIYIYKSEYLKRKKTGLALSFKHVILSPYLIRYNLKANTLLLLLHMVLHEPFGRDAHNNTFKPSSLHPSGLEYLQEFTILIP